nr:hypothetical protein [Tanacetum cinerariifolium]
MEQMTQLTSMYEMVCQIFQKKQEEKLIEKEQAAKARYWKIPACCDDDDDYDSAITPILSTEEPVNSLSMGDEHLDTIPATKSDEVIKSSVEDLVPILSESEVENGCDVPSCFTTFSNILFDDEYEFDSVDDQSLHNEDFSKKSFQTRILNIKMMGDIYDQKAFMHKLMITLAPREEKSPDLISHRCETVKKFNTHRTHLNKCPMLIHGQNNPPLDVLLFYFYPP